MLHGACTRGYSTKSCPFAVARYLVHGVCKLCAPALLNNRQPNILHNFPTDNDGWHPEKPNLDRKGLAVQKMHKPWRNWTLWTLVVTFNLKTATQMTCLTAKVQQLKININSFFLGWGGGGGGVPGVDFNFTINHDPNIVSQFFTQHSNSHTLAYKVWPERYYSSENTQEIKSFWAIYGLDLADSNQTLWPWN